MHHLMSHGLTILSFGGGPQAFTIHDTHSTLYIIFHSPLALSAGDIKNVAPDICNPVEPLVRLIWSSFDKINITKNMLSFLNRQIANVVRYYGVKLCCI